MLSFSMRTFFKLLCVHWLLLPVCLFAAPGDNIALLSNGATATMSSVFNPAWPASNCINGVTVSDEHAQLCHTSSSPHLNEWLDITLPTETSIGEIVVFNRTSCCSDRLLNVYVLVSKTPFPSGRDAASLAAARAQADFEYQFTTTPAVTTIAVSDIPGRYVRLQKAGGTQNNSNFINLLEVQVIDGTDEVELSALKTVSNTNPSVNDVVTFTITVNNAGPSIATGVMLSDAVPAGFNTITNISDGGTVDGSGVINWTIPTIAVAGSESVTFDARVVSP